MKINISKIQHKIVISTKPRFIKSLRNKQKKSTNKDKIVPRLAIEIYISLTLSGFGLGFLIVEKTETKIELNITTGIVMLIPIINNLTMSVVKKKSVFRGKSKLECCKVLQLSKLLE